MNAYDTARMEGDRHPRIRAALGAPARLGGLFALLAAAGSFAAEAEPPPPPQGDDLITQYVELDQIAPEVSGSAVTVYLTGRAPKLPEGTVLDVFLVLLSADVDKTTIKLDGSRKFTKFPFKVTKGVVFGDGYYIKLMIEFADQTPKVQEALRALSPRIFSGPTSQWTWSYMEGRLFRIGSAENEKAQLKETQAFFKDLLQRSIKVNNDLAAVVAEVGEGKKFAAGGKLDAAAWRKWLDGTWRKEVLDLQKKLEKWCEGSAALMSRHGEGVRAAWTLLELIARRSYLESRIIYGRYKLAIDENDVTIPDELKGLRIGTPKLTPTKATMNRLRVQLADEYDRVIDSFGLDLAKVKKAEPKKEEAGAESAPEKKEAAGKKEEGGSKK